jgi:uncharacterized protein YhaN
MRIEALELRAFGPFTGVVLDLARGESGLHVVHGRNEAGKSSALRALAAALFGIHGQTTDAFVHEYGALRVALRLRNRVGESFDFVRRKGNKQTLRAADDVEPLTEESLRRFLGDVDADEFHRVYGLDHVRLRQGGDALLDPNDGAAAAIVGASLGVRDLRRVRDALAADAGELFLARASKPRINAAIARWKELNSALRDRSLSATAWERARRDAARLIKERDASDAAERELRNRHGALALAKRNRLRIHELGRLRRELHDLADVPDLAADFEDRRRNALGDQREAMTFIARDGEELKERGERLAASPREFPLLDRLDEIEELKAGLHKVEKALSDRERRKATAESAAHERDRLALEIGLPVPVDRAALRDLKLALTSHERCEILVQEYTGITTKRRQTESKREKDRAALGLCEKRLASSPPIGSTEPLAKAVRAARRLGDVDGEIARLRSEIAEIEGDWNLAARRLRVAASDRVDREEVEAIVARPVPGPAVIESFAERFREHDDEERRDRVRRVDLAAQRASLESELDTIAGGGHIPGEDDLEQSREHRDAQWRLVRRAWLDGSDVASELAALGEQPPLHAAFERSVHRADELSDRMRRESDRVAQLENRRRLLAANERDLEVLKSATEERKRRREDLLAEWRTALSPSGLAARDPAELRDLLADRERLENAVIELRRVERLVAGHEERRANAAAALIAALAGVEDSATEVRGELAGPLERAEGVLESLEKREATRRVHECEREQLVAALRDADLELAALDKDFAAWSESFAAATRALPIRADDGPDAVLRTFHRVAAIVEHGREVEDKEDQIAKIDDDAATLSRSIAEFRDSHASHIPETHPGKFLAALVAAVERERKERQAKDALESEVRALEQKIDAAKRKAAIAAQAIVDLAREAGAESPDELPARIARAAEKRLLKERIVRIEDELRAEQRPIEEIEARVAEFENVDLETELAEHETRLAGARELANQKREQAEAARVLLGQLESGGGAAEVAAEMAAVGAELRSDVERYARLVLASRLLGAAVERFRSRHESPLLGHASRHFAVLTQGRYARVETDVDEQDHPHFVVIEAATKVAKTVAALSDGTRDQLHLALVLASLELRFDAGAEPMPLVLDDVLVHFDDARSRAAIEALAAFASRTQVLLFTHHEHVRDHAARLGAARGVFVHELE